MRKAAKWQIYLPLMRSVRIIVFFVPMNLPLGLASQEGSGLAEPVSDLLCSTDRPHPGHDTDAAYGGEQRRLRSSLVASGIG